MRSGGPAPWQVSLRDKNGAEKHVIERSAPVWSLQWNPSREEQHDVLAVACWDQTLSFYEISGAQFGKDKALAFDPCCVRHSSNGTPPRAPALAAPRPAPRSRRPRGPRSHAARARSHGSPRPAQASTSAWAAPTRRRRCGPCRSNRCVDRH